MKKDIKRSRYNLFFGKNIVYNMLSSRIVKVDSELYEFLLSKDAINPNDFESDSFNSLIKNNVIVNYNELEYIRECYEANYWGRDLVFYTIKPTLRCNFRCSYCFEKNKEGEISDEKIFSLGKFLQNEIRSREFVNVNWSGGEPLLVLDKISLICNIIQESVTPSSLRMTMNTNGFLLDVKTVARLKDLGFQRLNITIEGDKERHDSFRKVNFNESTFEKVLSNIEYASYFIPILIRFNTSNTEKESFEKFLDDLDVFNLLKRNVVISPNNLTLSKSTRDEQVESLNYFLSKHYDYINSIIQRGYKIEAYHVGLQRKYNRCSFHHNFSFNIDPYLNVYRCCYNGANEDLASGYINNDGEMVLKAGIKEPNSSRINPVSIKECRDCIVLPICMGKCYAEWLALDKVANSGCVSYKNSILKIIKQKHDERIDF